MTEVYLGFGQTVANLATLSLYDQAHLMTILDQTLDFIYHNQDRGLALPAYPLNQVFTAQDWQALPKSLDIYVCDPNEGQELNFEARGKDYATNILSYPSGLPYEFLGQMDECPLGELIICHEVVMRESAEQGKTPHEHLTHLVVHGILHLLGFDHELGQDEQDEMEGFEIQILQRLGIGNPYE